MTRERFLGVHEQEGGEVCRICTCMCMVIVPLDGIFAWNRVGLDWIGHMVG